MKAPNEHYDTPAKKLAMIKSLSQGVNVTQACKAAGVHRDTHYGWLGNDPEYERAIMESEESAIQSVEDAMWRMAHEKPAAGIFYLCNRRPKRWKNVNRMELTGANGAPIATELTLHATTLAGRSGAIAAILATAQASGNPEIGSSSTESA